MKDSRYHQQARDYYALCARAEKLGIPTSLDDPASPATVTELRAEVNAKLQGFDSADEMQDAYDDAFGGCYR